MDLPPYGWTDQQGEKHGIIYELNQEIAAKTGLPFDNQIIPFNRMFKMLSDGELDFISSQAHQPALDAGIITEPAFYYWARDLKLDPSKDFGDIIVIEDNEPQRIFVRRNLPEDIKKRIKEATMRLYQEKAFDRLKNKYRSK